MAQPHEEHDATSRLQQLVEIFEVRRAVGLVRATAWPWDERNKTLAPGHKRVTFIRHGEGYHNVAQREWKAAGNEGEPYTLETDPEMKYLDPKLTEVGVKEAMDLQAAGAQLCSDASGQPVQLIVTSTMRRATQTALIAFDSAVSEGVPVLATDMCHEIAGKHTCDKRLDILSLSQQFPDVVYYAKLAGGEEDPYWGDGYTREELSDVAARAGDFVDWLMKRPETSVVVASHSTWLLALFNSALDVEHEGSRTWFNTGEMRTMVLAPLRKVSGRLLPDPEEPAAKGRRGRKRSAAGAATERVAKKKPAAARK